MRRALIGWVLPLALGIVGGIALAQVANVLGLPPRLLVIALVVLGIGGQALMWIASGAAVGEILTWAVPLVIASSFVILWPTPLGGVVLGILLVLPIAGAAFPTVGRLMIRYVDIAARSLLLATLTARDRATRLSLSRAFTHSDVRADVAQLDDLPRTLSGLRRQAGLIRSVTAPDDGWSRVIDAHADAITAYHDMLGGLRAPDLDAALEELRAAQAMTRALLASRSTGYRILTHRFRHPDRETEVPGAGLTGEA